MTATTALTAQNTLGVTDIHYTPPEFVRNLIDACISDIGVDVVKTGNSLRNPFKSRPRNGCEVQISNFIRYACFCGNDQSCGKSSQRSPRDDDSD